MMAETMALENRAAAATSPEAAQEGADVVEIPACYAGKILRIDLTNRQATTFDTAKYLPDYVGGRLMANRIFWDEVPEGVAAYDPENKLIFMTGPGAGTGLPCGGRSVFTGISPAALPEMYSWSGIGGWFGSILKFAGYDGMIIEGKADSHTYVFIDDDKVEFLDADTGLWGSLVHDSQSWIKEVHGNNIHAVVIGPAGENLQRNASITTSSDNVAAKAGFGAVFGAKNLKAVAVRGTGTIAPANIDEVFELRATMGGYLPVPNQIVEEHAYGESDNSFAVDWTHGRLTCSYGCNMRCDTLQMGVKGAFEDKVTQVEKCVGYFTHSFTYDYDWSLWGNYMTEKIDIPICQLKSYSGINFDSSDPHFDELMYRSKGNIVNYWNANFDRGTAVMNLCNEYGIDKWEAIVFFMTWLSSAKQEGLLDDIDLGKEVDVNSAEFLIWFFDMITYRKGKYGPIFAEGMARAIRTLGKEKYGDTIYHGQYSRIIDQPIPVPVSLELAWGGSVHWNGHGLQATTQKPVWMATCLETMLVSRDTQTVMHYHTPYEEYLRFRDDPIHSDLYIQSIIRGEDGAEMKDMVPCCEQQTPDPLEPDLETRVFNAATGLGISVEQMHTLAERSHNLFRAILIRNHARTRQLEVAEILPMLQFPDPWGETCPPDEWNELVDNYYRIRGWDKTTGWPTRETYESCGLADVADQLEAVGKLPKPSYQAPVLYDIPGGVLGA
jgi:aldehyde:ferredoxin oxidoreductase